MKKIILVAIIARICLTPLAFHGDIITQAGWGKWIFDHGIRGFYENNIWIYGWPNQPPIISWLYGMGFKIYDWLYTGFIVGGSFIANHHLGAGHLRWFYSFVEWWGNAKYIDTPFKIGELISMKIWSIGGDAILAYMIYKITKSKLAATVFLISPFTWYESAIWGQHDQLGLIFLLLSFWLVGKEKYIWLSPIMMAISILIKPTAFIFGPLLAWMAIRDKRTIGQMIIGGIMALLGYFLLVWLISPVNFWQFNLNLQRQMFAKGEMWTWVNTFNFWRITTGHLTDYRETLLWISLKNWGYILFGVINLLAFKINQKRDWNGTLKAIFIVGFGGWMFMVTMHERYLFSAIAVGLILAFKNKKLFKHWVVLSLIFWISLYNGWWYPENIEWLKNVLTWGDFFDGPIPKLLAIINLSLMLIMIRILFRNDPVALEQKKRQQKHRLGLTRQ